MGYDDLVLQKYLEIYRKMNFKCTVYKKTIDWSQKLNYEQLKFALKIGERSSNKQVVDQFKKKNFIKPIKKLINNEKTFLYEAIGYLKGFIDKRVLICGRCFEDKQTEEHLDTYHILKCWKVDFIKEWDVIYSLIKIHRINTNMESQTFLLYKWVHEIIAQYEFWLKLGMIIFRQQKEFINMNSKLIKSLEIKNIIDGFIQQMSQEQINGLDGQLYYGDMQRKRPMKRKRLRKSEIQFEEFQLQMEKINGLNLETRERITIYQEIIAVLAMGSQILKKQRYSNIDIMMIDLESQLDQMKEKNWVKLWTKLVKHRQINVKINQEEILKLLGQMSTQNISQILHVILEQI